MEELVMKGKNPDIKITGPGIEQLYQNEEYADLVSEKISSRMWFDETNMAWIIEYMPSFAHEGLTQLFLGAYSNAALLNNNEELFRQGGCPCMDYFIINAYYKTANENYSFANFRRQ